VEFASEEEKVNEALYCFMVPEGPEFMVVSGGGGAAAVIKDHVMSAPRGLPARSLIPPALLCLVRVKVLAFMLEASIASEKVASTLSVTATAVALFCGNTPLTVGAMVS
jgi:hypothetical protein